MQENNLNKEQAKKQREKERLQDVAAQEAYARMLDQQEQDRKNELMAREKRSQDFMNRMADGVLKTMDNIQKKEDEMIVKYEREREVKMRMDEELKHQKLKQKQEEILRTLGEQQQAKKRREVESKEELNKQADMWQKERDIWREEEQRIQEKIQKINKETQNFLKMQEDEKRGAKSKKMVKTEKQLNKGLIREIK